MNCKTNHLDHKEVYKVKSLEEASRILSSAENIEIKNLLKSGFITIWVLTVNRLLDILKFLLFKKWGYTKKEFKNIVVYTVGIVGDNVVMLPALAALRRSYPAAKITVITNCQIWDRQGAIGVLEPSPYKDHLIVLNVDPVQRRGLRLWMDETKFGEIRCDLFVNLSPFGNRGWVGAVVREMCFARMLGAKYAVGFRMSTYTRKDLFCKVQYRFLKNEPRRSQEILKELGLNPVENEDLLAHDPVAKESVIKKIREKGGDNLPLFVINPGAKLRAKCWPAECFGKVISELTNHYNVTAVVTGISDERNIADRVVETSGRMAINLAGQTTVQELVELLRMAKGCITNDTGAMHIAAMVGAPTVAIFSGRYSPLHWLPLGENVVSIFSYAKCTYCYKDWCQKPECLENIKVENVLDAFNEVVGLANKGWV